MPIILPLAIKYGLPLAVLGVTHLVAWLHGRFTGKKIAQKGGTPNVVNS